ncbi:MAG: hypothetical protein F4Y03_03910 [Alphaproteobacteria bacterium]|nr:hypothetical protein [Alphaproteobacteria bacterium]
MATERLSLRIDADLKRSLEREAEREERSTSYLAVKAIEAMLRSRAEKREAIRSAVAEAEKGVFISQEAMDAWVASWGTDAELPPPEPDIHPDPT